MEGYGERARERERERKEGWKKDGWISLAKTWVSAAYTRCNMGRPGQNMPENSRYSWVSCQYVIRHHHGIKSSKSSK